MPTLLYNNIAFIHVPKTGGNSISSLIYNSEYFITKYINILINYDHYLLLHAPASLVKNNENVSDMIAFVRNPYTRFISMFCKSKDLNMHNYPINIEGLVQFCNDFKTSNLNNEIIFKPMTYFIYDNSTCLVKNILRFEDFDNEVLVYLKLMGVENNPHIPQTIPYINNNIHINNNNYQELYVAYPALYNFVNEIYEEDFINFNYPMIK